MQDLKIPRALQANFINLRLRRLGVSENDHSKCQASSARLRTAAPEDLGDLRRENVTAAFGHDDALLPADAKRRAGDERIGLIGHVGLERIHGAGFRPRRFDLDDAGGVQRAVDEVVLEAVVHEVLIELLGNVASHHAGLDLLARPLVRLTAELDDVAALALELTEADRVANGGGIAVDLGRKVQLDNVALLKLAVTRTGDGMAGMPVTRRRR